ncbi:hypothetical protein [Thalassoroseus pseudoceratinae]|uniref:hypothetical protein n=1 Tax=Thalassoroseus pseudoceratinae TaxID=2713176 RepID=UPI001420E5D2|nr:hypothetical protein [Thalassoroseus pseudoceratinae]
MQLNVSYDLRPKRASVNTSIVMDGFGIGFETGQHTIAEDFELPIRPDDVVLFTGASGSGKSSLMRNTGEQLRDQSGTKVVNVDDLELPDRVLVDALGVPVHESLALLSACGLAEARLLLRTPNELSDGQRYRFRLALALAQHPDWVIADEFTATLDRTLAKIVAFNIRRLAHRTGIGFLLATTHDDVASDLDPSLHVVCRLDGRMECTRNDEPISPRKISFFDDLKITVGSKTDWPAFADWHYRSHHLGLVKRVSVLWHGEEKIGICVFASPPISLSQRNRFFGLNGGWSRTSLRALNSQLVTLSRVVLHPSYRGAGLAAWFIRESCRACPWPWIETLAQMGHLNPFFEKAGFVRVGVTQSKNQSRRGHSAIYGGNRNGQTKISHETHEKSRHSQPVYYVFDNRSEAARDQGQEVRAGKED